MTKGEATATEINEVVFPMKFDQENKEIVTSAETTEQIIVENDVDKIKIGLRFARLKKSLRKRSVSIL